VGIASRDDFVLAPADSVGQLAATDSRAASAARAVYSYARLVTLPLRRLSPDRLAAIHVGSAALAQAPPEDPASPGAARTDLLLDLLGAACPAFLPLHPQRQLVPQVAALLAAPGAGAELQLELAGLPPAAQRMPAWALLPGPEGLAVPWLAAWYDATAPHPAARGVSGTVAYVSALGLGWHAEYAGAPQLRQVVSPHKPLQGPPPAFAGTPLLRVHQSGSAALYVRHHTASPAMAAGGGPPAAPLRGVLHPSPLVLASALVLPLPGQVPAAATLLDGEQGGHGVAVMFWLRVAAAGAPGGGAQAEFHSEESAQVLCEVGALPCDANDPAVEHLPPFAVEAHGDADGVAAAVHSGRVANGLLPVPRPDSAAPAQPARGGAATVLRWSQTHELYVDGLLQASQVAEADAPMMAAKPGADDAAPAWMHLYTFALAGGRAESEPAGPGLAVDGVVVYDVPLWQADVMAARNRQVAAGRRAAAATRPQ
jgi:hypothetical protein